MTATENAPPLNIDMLCGAGAGSPRRYEKEREAGAVVRAGGAPRLMDRFCGREVPPALSLTVTLIDTGLPVALVGVPLMSPLAAFRVSPAGKVPVLTVQPLYGGTPSAAVNCAE